MSEQTITTLALLALIVAVVIAAVLLLGPQVAELLQGLPTGLVLR